MPAPAALYFGRACYGLLPMGVAERSKCDSLELVAAIFPPQVTAFKPMYLPLISSCCSIPPMRLESIRWQREAPVERFRAVPTPEAICCLYCPDCKHSGGAMALVVVAERSRTSPHARQPRPRAAQGLDLALFVHGRERGVGGRIQMQTDHISQLFDEPLGVRQLERPGRRIRNSLQDPLKTRRGVRLQST
jgi:hypothetical protein